MPGQTEVPKFSDGGLEGLKRVALGAWRQEGSRQHCEVLAS